MPRTEVMSPGGEFTRLSGTESVKEGELGASKWDYHPSSVCMGKGRRTEAIPEITLYLLLWYLHLLFDVHNLRPFSSAL